MTTVRIAVVRIPRETLAERHPIEATEGGWGRFEGPDGAPHEVRGVADALLVRFEGAATGLAAAFGDLWALHVESRGIAVHDAEPEGETYDALVEGASWEGGLFSGAAAALGAAKAAEPEGDDEEGEEGEEDEMAEKLLAAADKRSSRKVLGALLAADHGQKDLGDVLDAFEAETKEGDDALIDEVEDRFALDPEQSAMAAMLKGSGLDVEGEEGEEGAEGDAAPAEELPDADDDASGVRSLD
ncbi:MAG: hypothetical protein H6721_03345 [Sandaracinus sp.]|nr:hypothetical protein [Sandaracinus sp.]MCB9631168.1 hypothetical protein [Sandaracinus sp.]